MSLLYLQSKLVFIYRVCHFEMPSFYSCPQKTNQSLLSTFFFFMATAGEGETRGVKSATSTLDVIKSYTLVLFIKDFNEAVFIDNNK